MSSKNKDFLKITVFKLYLVIFANIILQKDEHESWNNGYVNRHIMFNRTEKN